VFYTGRAEPAGDPCGRLSRKDEKVEALVLAAPTTSIRHHNKILEAYLKSKGVKQEDIMINYTPFGHSDWQTIWPTSRSSARPARRRRGLHHQRRRQRSLLQGAGQPGHQGERHSGCRVSSAKKNSPASTPSAARHLAAWNYFQSIKDPANEKFIKAWQTYTKNPKRVTNDPMEARHRSKCGSRRSRSEVDDADKVIDALPASKPRT